MAKTPTKFGSSSNKPNRFRILSRIIFGKTVPQKLFRSYLILIAIGVLLLSLPMALKHPNQMVVSQNEDIHDFRHYYFIDALFIACSAITDTGLSPAIVSETFTVFGQVVIFLLIEIGGLGMLTIIFLIWHMFKPKKSMNLNQVIILQAERGNEKIAGTYKTLKFSILFILIIQAIFTIFIALWLCFVPAHTQVFRDSDTYALSCDDPTKYTDCYWDFGKSLWQGLFISISASNNAGFDIFKGGVSLASYRNDWHIILQLMVLILFVFGGIGFPLIYDLYEKHKAKKYKEYHRLSLFTKIAILGFVVVAILGFIFSYSFEYGYTSAINNHPDIYDVAHYVSNNHEFGKVETLNKIWAIFFNSLSTRSAGFSTINQSILSPGTQWTNIILMFIGGSPSSTAGGIRTTTLMIVIWTMISKTMGRDDVVMFKRKISNHQVKDALLVTIVAVVLVAFTSVIVFHCVPDNSDHSMLQSFYETTSAFGTVGFTMGFTSSVDTLGLCMLILIMFIGQLGISSTLLAWTKKNPKGNLIKYPEERVRIG